MTDQLTTDRIAELEQALQEANAAKEAWSTRVRDLVMQRAADRVISMEVAAEALEKWDMEPMTPHTYRVRVNVQTDRTVQAFSVQEAVQKARDEVRSGLGYNLRSFSADSIEKVDEYGRVIE